MKPLGLTALLAIALLSTGCLELVRRPGPKSGPTAARKGTVSTDAAEASSNPVQPVAKSVPTVERSNRQHRSIRQVNEYALWCIENDMWNEARTHMERALAEDSLSASLHNNLAIVYEHLGKTDLAGDFYQRAASINPAEQAYRANLQGLQDRQQALADTSSEFDLFRMPDRDGRRRASGLDESSVPPVFIGE